MTRWRSLLSILLSGTACGGEATTPQGPGVEIVHIVPGVLGALPGVTVQMSYLAYDSSNNPITGRAVTWQTTDPSVARFDATGLLTTIVPGEILVSVTLEGKESSARFTVLKPVASVDFNVPMKLLVLPSRLIVDPVPRSVDGDSLGTQWRHIRWTTSNPAIATVSPLGEPSDVQRGDVRAVAFGDVTITMTAIDENVSGSFTLRFGRLSYTTLHFAHSAGSFYCGLVGAGDLYCWAFDKPGQIYTPPSPSDGSVTTLPTPMKTDQRFDSLSAGESVACGLAKDQHVYCWGANSYGQLGNGGETFTWTPTRVSSNLFFRSVAVGEFRSCAIAVDNSVWCWGIDNEGEFGNGASVATTAPHRTPTPAVSGIPMKTIALSNEREGPGDAACGISMTGTLLCWGANTLGQAGNGQTDPGPIPPTPVLVPEPLFSVSVGGAHACALTADGRTYCWGNHFAGIIPQDTPTPVRINTPVRFVQLSATAHVQCGRTLGGDVWCWGAEFGPLPVKIGLPAATTDIRSSAGKSCAVTVQGEGYCWNSSTSGVVQTPGL